MGSEKGALVYHKMVFCLLVLVALMANALLILDFNFVPMYVISDSDGSTAWMVQKQLTGHTYPSSADAVSTSSINITLNAFGHYSLERYGLYFDQYEGK